ncbi:pyrroloquinoline quinone-dependent dehydrogenase [Sphingobium sp. EP60837]|uniref:pyrroloquinoline quinone-dependent dehydrogenase n=1 Tax=Sphingobium sp. EP60837 TaxID=1855519 RepID=UPI0007DD5AFB|nr:pyrroloquinoline quinone-dependent dehydrogenase [Sphingobium sp. EP60837]ANI78331.1 Quinoprotein glucose dehydrogenase (PQQ, quinone) [Sphingobium sp. EP60837]
MTRKPCLSAGRGTLLLGLTTFVAACAMNARPGSNTVSDRGDWPVYGGNAGGDRYSELGQIDTRNVGKLEQVWRVDFGPGGLQTTPLVIGGVLYATTPGQKTVAMSPETGAKLWEYDPGSRSTQPIRGLAYWREGAEAHLFTSYGSYLVALSPETGQPIPTFGKDGRVDLRDELGRDPATMATFLTSPATVFKDLVIVGFRTSETAPAAPGSIRAYDARTGKLRWKFDVIPHPGEPGYDSWPTDAWKTAGGANNWAGMVVDERRGILFVPTGSAVNDFYGADRVGNNLYANSLIALDAATGRRLWHFQGVHHDLWDRDFPSPPVLLTVRRGGKSVNAVAQGSKQGMLFLFDRVTGKPLFPIEERPVPASDVPGEVASPTQPFALTPAPFARQHLTADMLTNRTPEARAAAEKAFATFNNKGPFTPLTVGKQTVVFPGFDGGAEWGGPAVDHRRGVIYINSNDVVWTGGLAETKPAPAAGNGAALYQEQCSACHGANRDGAPPEFPPLTNLSPRLDTAQIAAIIAGGKGRMPGFPQIPPADRAAIASYLAGGRAEASNGEQREAESAAPAVQRARYRFTGYRKFLDAQGYPAVAPPWGTLNAIDLNTGRYLWKIPLGEYPELSAKGMRDTGSENYGGPIVTAGGLVIIGATIYDRKLRAFDSRTGKLLWQTELPFAGVATPVTYMAGGRQFIVIATSGSRNPKGPQGSAYVAFALPTGR